MVGHSSVHDICDLHRRFDKVRIGKVGVACRGAVSAVPEQLADQRQVLARHDRLARRRVAPMSRKT